MLEIVPSRAVAVVEGSQSHMRYTLSVITVYLCVVIGRPCAAADPAAEPYLQAREQRNNLEYGAAGKALESWLSRHPDDLHALSDLATVILHREMFYRGILGSHIYGELGDMFRTGEIPYTANFQQRLFSVLDNAQSLAEQRLKLNPNDQDALYWAGTTHAARALFYFTMAKSYLAALHESTDARKYHAQLVKINPGFADAWLVIGLNDYVAGSLPWYLKFLASIAGYRGNREEGIDEVRRAREQGHWARDDAALALAVLTRREKMYPETLRILQGLAQEYPRNFLVQREIAGIYRIEGDLPAASKALDDLVAKWDQQQPGFADMPAAKILYESGMVHQQLGEMDTALARFERASKVPGDDIFVYRAKLAAADLYVRQNRRPAALREYRRVAESVPETDEGKAAKRAMKRIQSSGGQRADSGG